MNDTALRFAGLLMLTVIAVVMLMLGLMCLSLARDFGQWDATPADERAWYQSVRQPDTQSSCCGEADAYYADSFETEDGEYVAIITDERVVEHRPLVPVGTKIKVPNNKLPNPKLQTPNPTGHGVIFLNTNRIVLCYFPPLLM